MRAELSIGLHVDSIRPVVEVEVVHVRRPQQDLHRVRDLAERHPDRFGLLTIDVDNQLRIVGGELREESRQSRRLIRLRGQLLRRGAEVLDRSAGLIEELVGDAAEEAQPVDRRRQERNHHGAGDLAERAKQLPDDGLRRLILAPPLAEVRQLREQNALIRRAAGEAEPAGREHLLGFAAPSA